MSILAWLNSVSETPQTLFLALLLIKISLLLGLAWIVHALLAFANPRWRVLVWRITAGGLLAIAVFSFSPQGIRLELLPGDREEQVAAVAAKPQESHLETPLVTSDEGRSSESPESRLPDPKPTKAAESTAAKHPFLPQAPPVRTVLPAANRPPTHAHEKPTVPMEVENVPSDSPSPEPALVTTPRNLVPEQETSSAGVSSWLGVFAVWLFGFAVLGASAVIGWIRLRRIRLESASIPDWVRDEVESLSGQLPSLRNCRVRQTTQVPSPCLSGGFRPMLLLPTRQCLEENRIRLRAILRHETVHLEKHDAAWNYLWHGLTVVFWFHPLVWRVRRAHAAACDGVADAVAADFLGDVAGYSRLLAKMALEVHQAVTPAALAMARTSDVRRRIEALSRRLFSAELPRRVVYSIVTASALSIALLAGTTLVSAEADPQTPPATAQKDAAPQSPEVAEKVDPANPAKPGEETLVVSIVEKETQKPLPKVSVQFSGRIGGQPYRALLDTDERGIVTTSWPAEAEIQYLWLTAYKERFVPIHYSWRSEQAKIEMPARLDLEFDRGRTIGGVVQDEAGKPIENAHLEFTMPITWPKLANHVFTADSVDTDVQGRWKWDGARKRRG
jgi:beta-lactamase regulating signal transducer with metallopeptidase domain